MSSRRFFLKNSIITSIGVAGFGLLPHDVFATRKATKLTILHTNDVHSHIDPFPVNDPKYAGLGGINRRAALIKKIRAQEENVLLFDAGDIFQGTPYFNLYGGEIEFKLMSEMGYDASTMGNHDFDNGLDGFNKMLQFANFPFIISNYDFKDTVLNKKTLPYKIFNKGDLKIGVFGIGIELEGLVDKRNYGNTIYSNPIEKSAHFAYKLKKELHCDIVICLSHLGYNYKSDKISDVVLAKQSKNIDLIIGGHTHTFLDAPIVYKNRDMEDVIVSQAGWAGIRMGRIDFILKKRGVTKSKFLVTGNSILVSEKNTKA